MQAASERDIRRRLPQIVAAVRELAELEFVNGGRNREPGAHRRGGRGHRAHRRLGLLRPGAVRPLSLPRPDPRRLLRAADRAPPAPGVVTALGGGYPASGGRQPDRAARALPARGPSPRQAGGRRRGADAAPAASAARRLRVGDRVYMRHAKAGELCERFDSLYLVEGDRIVDQVPTYRGEGKAFL